MEKRLFIVSNRLPVIIDEEKGIRPVSGGLVSSLGNYVQNVKDNIYKEVYWAGVPGCQVNTWFAHSKQLTPGSFTYLPVFVPPVEYEDYYSGLSNAVIWPLFHYFPSFAEYNAESYSAYEQVNQRFAETLIKHLRPGDKVWIHDYHLLPLAGMLRSAIPELTIGFFLHIPFPSFELFRLLPRKWQADLLKGMLGADLIGFHTIDYASHFLQSILTVLGLDHERHIINYENRLVKVDVFPIGIDYTKYNRAYQDVGIAAHRDRLLEQMNNRKIIFSVDRLDYTKGVHNRLRAFEYFLQRYPEYHNKVVFILVIVPSRDNIPKYIERKILIDELISNINSKTGNINWIPVIYQYNHLEFEEMMALYSACDLALITPLRDGMNLVAKEFVASRQDKKGVLVLSEMAGAARELTDALLINPNDVVEIAVKIREGLEMPVRERVLRIETMQKRIATYDIHAWAEDFMNELEHIRQKQQSFQIKFMDEYTRREMYDSYRHASRRLLLLDYDGTLAPFTANPDDAIPNPGLLGLLQSLAETPGTTVCIISGRSSAWLEKHLGMIDVNLVAEHGARYKRNGEWITEVQTNQDWKERVQHIMEMYERRCANTFIEEKDFSMVWHYRNANIDQGKLKASELANDLNDYIHHRNLQVLMGNKIVEVRQSGFNKGSFIKNILHQNTYDFVLTIGDDKTDEDMFKVLVNRKGSFTIKVGMDASYAQYNLHTPQMVISMLEGMSYLAANTTIQ
ncbi:MAG: bifunctional alpha,alpha-trehalose-phosphate synthase (UDP-forming)/trehalose-phosphatase [Niastella sp.]|nr:bifunctional alpha,alpha-trehalose-phosphate synthase (UDP-forming)/trehalose-phosphatase [Niastella sp.]